MGGSILGNRVLRKEDPKFLTVGGTYVDDLHDEPLLAGAAHVTYVRSQFAHGTIVAIDTSEAEAMPGVIAVYTAASLGLEPVGAPFNPTVARTLLASDKVRYVGEPVAVIITEDRAQGEDAANAEQKAALAAGKILIKDAIADITLQQVLTRPAEDVPLFTARSLRCSARQHLK